VAKSGYEIIEGTGTPIEGKGEPRTGRFLSAINWKGYYHEKLYSPFTPEHRALPRRFADLASGGEERFVEFANTYGQLHDAEIYVVGSSCDDNRWAEPVSVWQSEAEAMACAIGLWDAEVGKI
jgi:hypothetical protein